MGKAVQFQPPETRSGEPLYVSVRNAVRAAIDDGRFGAGDRLPSTKAISEQMNVSLVTVHRALQELVSVGVLRRGQGRGTFVHEEYRERASMSTGLRFGLVFHAECSLADSYHGLILEGVRQGADEYGADLVLLHFGEDWRRECHGFIYVNPFRDQLEKSPIVAALTERRGVNGAGVNGQGVDGVLARRGRPVTVVGASFDRSDVSCIDTDNAGVARQAVEHLLGLGHRRMVYVGGGDHIANNRDRFRGFVEACRVNELPLGQEQIDRGNGWKFEPAQEEQLRRLLTSDRPPTAIFAAGYYYALGVYSIANALGLNVPGDLSVVGVDDPPSAEHLSPPLTTVRQPLMQMGRLAVRGLFDQIGSSRPTVQMTKLSGELIVRGSTAGSSRATSGVQIGRNGTPGASSPLPNLAGRAGHGAGGRGE